MMYNEFVERTGIEVSNEEYEIIEESYYDSELMKDDFCKEWLKQRKAGKWEIELKFRKRLKETENKAFADMKNMNAQLTNYREALEISSEAERRMRDERNSFEAAAIKKDAEIAELQKEIIILKAKLYDMICK